MPAPKGNQNAIKSGRRVRSGLQIGGHAKGNGYVTVALRQLRKSLETAVLAAHGEIDLTHGALINSCCRWERVAALGTKWLRTEGNGLPTLDRMNLVRSIAQASDSRDKCIKALGIDAVANGNPLAAFHARPAGPLVKTPESDSHASCTRDAMASESEHQNALGASVGDSAGTNEQGSEE